MNRISGVIVSVFTVSVADCGFKPNWGNNSMLLHINITTTAVTGSDCIGNNNRMLLHINVTTTTVTGSDCTGNNNRMMLHINVTTTTVTGSDCTGNNNKMLPSSTLSPLYITMILLLWVNFNICYSFSLFTFNY